MPAEQIALAFADHEDAIAFNVLIRWRRCLAAEDSVSRR